jgi:hypothetical protein
MARNEVAALALIAAPFAVLPSPAFAGPPFATDDPAPTPTGHWEVYLFADAGGRGSEFDGTGGADVNYGVAPGSQLTLTVPMRVSSGDGEGVAVGDVDVGLKYRFLSSPESGWSAAFSPRFTVPIFVGAGASDRISGELPVWIGKTMGDWSLFGGGGYAFHPGPDGRDGWFGGVAATGRVSRGVMLGVEVNRRDPDSADAHGETGFVAGAVVQLAGPFALYVSGGPALIDDEPTRYTLFVALGAVF